MFENQFSDDGRVPSALVEPINRRTPQFKRDTVSDHSEDDFVPSLVVRYFDQIETKEVSWLWRDRIPSGMFTMISGDPGTGKTFLTLDICSRLSTGRAWPDTPEEPRDPCNVMYVSSEDSPEHTLRPRLLAAGANMGRICFLDGAQKTPDGDPIYLSLVTDLGSLERRINQDQIKAVIFDPIMAYLDGVDSHKNAEVRGLLGPLCELALRTDCGVVGINHLNKMCGVKKSLYRSLGSIGFAGTARQTWAVGYDPDDETCRVFAPGKSNLVEKQPGLKFKLTASDDPDEKHPRIEWGENFEGDADDLLSERRASKGPTTLDVAMDFLKETLSDGPMSQPEIMELCKSEGHKERTIYKAKKILEITSAREGFGERGQYRWSLPEQADITALEGANNDAP